MKQPASSAPSWAPKTDIVYAGFWWRLLAYLIDVTLLAGVELAIFYGVHVLAPNDLNLLANVIPVAGAIAWAYFAVLESSALRATLGKAGLGLYVGDMRGDPITFRRATFRNAFKTLSWLVLGCGWILAGFTPRKQALHDLLAGTIVLRKVNYFVIGPQPPTEPGDHWDGTRWVASVPPLEKS